MSLPKPKKEVPLELRNLVYGTKLRCINNTDCTNVLEIGKIYTFIGYIKGTRDSVWISVSGLGYDFYASRFELVEKSFDAYSILK